MASTLIAVYEEFVSILADLKAARIGYFTANERLTDVSNKARLFGANLTVPSIYELKGHHLTAVADESYESSEEPYEEPYDYESSYESSEC